MVNANAAHRQRDGTERPHGQSEYIEHRTEHFKHLVLCDDGEVFVAVALQQQAFDACGDSLGVAGGFVEDVDLHQSLTIEQRQRPPHRNVDAVVEIESQHLAFRFHGADHAVGLAADTHALAQRRSIAEQFAMEFAAEYRKGTGMTWRVTRQEAPERGLYLPHRRHIGTGAEDEDAAAAIAPFHGAVALHQGNHGSHAWQAFHRFGIVQRKRPYRADDRRREAKGLGLARSHRQQVGTELGEFFDDEALHTFTERSEQYHCSDADGDAQAGKNAAQRLGNDGATGELKQIDRKRQGISLLAPP